MLKTWVSKFNKVMYKPYIARINIDGDIDDSTAHLIGKSLEKIKPKRLKAIALTINSEGGSAAQAVIINEKLKSYCKKHNVPFITFGQDSVLSSGFMILSAGDEVYCEQSTVLGSIGTIYRNFKVINLLRSYEVGYNAYTTNENNLVDLVDPFMDNIKESKNNKHLNRVARNSKTLMVNYVKRSRPNASSVQRIYEGELLTANECEHYNLIDGIDNFLDYFDRNYEGIDIKEFTVGGYFSRLFDLVGPFLVKNDFDFVRKKIIYGLLAKFGRF